MIGAIFTLIWLFGFILMVIYSHHRLIVNYRKGLIIDPTDPIGWLTMMFKCFFWPFYIPVIIEAVLDAWDDRKTK